MDKFSIGVVPLQEINPHVTRVKIAIGYAGKNRNNFDIPRETFDNMSNTLKGAPIVGAYYEGIDDMGGHKGNRIKVNGFTEKTKELMPYGFVAYDVEPYWENINGREYYTTIGYMWTEKYKFLKNLLKNGLGQSMEIYPDGDMVNGYFKTTNADIVALAMLGDQIEPCFEEGGIKEFSVSEFSKMLEEMQKSVEEFAMEEAWIEEQLRLVEEEKKTKLTKEEKNEIVKDLAKQYEQIQRQYLTTGESKIEDVKSTKVIQVKDIYEDLYNSFGYKCSDEEIELLKEEFYKFSIAEKYSHINFKPTESMAKAAQRGLDMREKQSPSNRGGTAVGLARARQLIKRQELSPDIVKRMYSFFSRHEVDKKSDSWKKGNSKGEQAWLLWGGDEGFSWSRKIVGQMEKADKKKDMSYDDRGEDMSEFAIEKGINEPIDVDTSKDNAIDGEVGSKDVQELKRRVFMAKNYKSLIPKVFMKHPKEINEDTTLSDVGYPVMYFRDGKLYYHLGFIKAASSRIEQNKDQPYYDEVKRNIMSVRNKVGMPKEFEKEMIFAVGMKEMIMKMVEMMKKYMAKPMYMQKDENGNMYMVDGKAMYAMYPEQMKMAMIPYAMKEDGEVEMAYDEMKEMAMDEIMMGMMSPTMDYAGEMFSKLESLESENKELKEKNLDTASKFSDSASALESMEKEIKELKEFKDNTIAKEKEEKEKQEFNARKVEADEFLSKRQKFFNKKETEEFNSKLSEAKKKEDIDLLISEFTKKALENADRIIDKKGNVSDFSMMPKIIHGDDVVNEDKPQSYEDKYKKYEEEYSNKN